MTESSTWETRFSFGWLTRWSLTALLAGLALGFAGHYSGRAGFATLAAGANAVGELWIAALQMITLPLAVVLTLAAVANASTKSVGALTLRAILFFVVALLLAGCFALFVTPLLLAPYAVDPAISAALSRVAVPASAAGADSVSVAAGLGGLVPKNIFAAAARGDIFPLLLFAILFGLAVTQLPAEQRLPLSRGLQALARAMLVLVGWLLVVTPLGVFALTYLIALNTGATWFGTLGVYLLLRVGVTLLCVLLLYPVSMLFGRTTLRSFARAVLPAQLVAVSTRSSVAALPALVAGGRQHAGLSVEATDFVLPLSVSLFRIGTVVANPIKLVFLAHVYGITLQPEAVALFLGTEILFTLSASGTPNSGGGAGFRMVPVFLAAGIPIQGLLLLEAVETVPDIFETLANVTGQMCAATVIPRRR